MNTSNEKKKKLATSFISINTKIGDEDRRLAIGVVGGEEEINDICQYTILHSQGDLDLEVFVERAAKNNVFCFAQADTLQDKPVLLKLKKLLKKNNIYIEQDRYLEACICTGDIGLDSNNDFFYIDEETISAIKKHSIWSHCFEYDI